MSIKLMDRVMDLGLEVNGTKRLVLLVLADFANSDGEAWPSKRTIAKRAGLTKESTVRTALRWLEESGYIETVVQGAVDNRIPADKRPNLFKLTIPANGGTSDVPPGKSAGVLDEARGGTSDVPSGGTPQVPQTTINKPPKNRHVSKEQTSLELVNARDSTHLVPAKLSPPPQNDAESFFIEMKRHWPRRPGQKRPGKTEVAKKRFNAAVKSHGLEACKTAARRYVTETDWPVNIDTFWSPTMWVDYLTEPDNIGPELGNTKSAKQRRNDEIQAIGEQMDAEWEAAGIL